MYHIGSIFHKISFLIRRIVAPVREGIPTLDYLYPIGAGRIAGFPLYSSANIKSCIGKQVYAVRALSWANANVCILHMKPLDRNKPQFRRTELTFSYPNANSCRRCILQLASAVVEWQIDVYIFNYTAVILKYIFLPSNLLPNVITSTVSGKGIKLWKNRCTRKDVLQFIECFWMRKSTPDVG